MNNSLQNLERKLCKFPFRYLGLDTDFHNQQVLFPTVTICPLVDPALVNETVSKTLSLDDDEDSDELLPVWQSLPKLSYDTLGNTYEAVLNISGDLDLMKYNLRQLAFKVGVKCEELLEICKYKDDTIPCCEYFNPLYSEHGLCYSFNARYYGTPEDE